MQHLTRRLSVVKMTNRRLYLSIPQLPIWKSWESTGIISPPGNLLEIYVVCWKLPGSVRDHLSLI